MLMPIRKDPSIPRRVLCFVFILSQKWPDVWDPLGRLQKKVGKNPKNTHRLFELGTPEPRVSAAD